MDPVTAIGLAANILSFIDYSAKVISASIDIYGSVSGNTQESGNSEVIATEMRRFAAKLQPPSTAQVSGEEKALCNLATECEALAKKILDLLEKLKPKNRKSKSSSLVAGLKTKFYEGERRKLEEQLSSCRIQLDLQLNYLTSSKTQVRLNTLVTSAKDDSAKIQHLQDQLEHLGQGIPIESFTPNAQNQLRLLLGLSERACDVIAQYRILESLAFEGMYGRYEEVDEAHFETLRWIYDDGLYTNNEDKYKDEAKTSAREMLLNWISSGAGIFHISGKLGSGKSTLMKYLSDHNRTNKLLGQWAGERQLVFARFFFWKPGSKMQKSLAGLIRSLLHDVLKAYPHLIRAVLPDYWDRVKSTPWQVQLKLPLSNKDIREAFSRLISDPKLYTNYCFCFFIDGLDEYEGTHQEDPKTLVDLLNSWTNLAPTTVKICISSREYNVFMNAFSNEQRISLQNLTRLDMTRYVLDKFRYMDRKEDRTKLTKAIVENAQGIFLWVTLVVKRIREQIENGVDLSALHSEIDCLPRELNDLFEYILNSLADSDLKAAYQTFSMVLELKQHNMLLTLLSYSFLNDFTREPVLCSREDSQYQTLTQEERALRVESARKRLNGYCRGLLETRQDPREETSEGIVITHRSISEFLSSGIQRARMQQYLIGFNSVDAISRLTLAELCSREPGNVKDSSYFDVLALELVHLRSMAKLDGHPYSFLVSLALAWQRHQVQGNHDSSGMELRARGKSGVTLIDIVPTSGISTGSRMWQTLRHPIYTAALLGSDNYVLWELGRNPGAIHLFTPQLLLNCTLVSPEMHLVEASFDRKARFGIRFGDENTEVSLWHHILLRCCRFWLYPSRYKGLVVLGEIVEKFLEYGADPYFYISVTNPPKYTSTKLVVRVKGVVQEQKLSFKYPPGPGRAENKCENVSLVELVEQWGFENKTRVLELIKKNALMLEAANDQTKGTILPEKEEVGEKPLATVGMDDSATLDDLRALPSESISDGCGGDLLTGFWVFGSPNLFGLSAAISLGILVPGILMALLMQWPFG
ncbi:hypothetical protein BGZ57DRAFT_1008652 [Hyaloscypha finlandica]|nr:hypothetical protein BGZ57DRAFT_1008652 [Hyaloscypha finlandica]